MSDIGKTKAEIMADAARNKAAAYDEHARELVEKAGVGETADAVWRDLDKEREKIQPRSAVAVESEPEEDSAPVLELPVMPASQSAPMAFGIDLAEAPVSKRRKSATLWPTAKESDLQLSLFD